MATPISPTHPRITRDHDICHGQLVVRGLRYPVWSVLEYLASDLSEAEILADYEDLEAEDLRACQAYAAGIFATNLYGHCSPNSIIKYSCKSKR